MTRLPLSTYPRPLLAPLLVALSLCAVYPANAMAGTEARPAIEVNLDVLNSSPPRVAAPTRIIDGETVIILTPPSLQQKAPPTPPRKIARPLTKPSLKLPEMKMASAKPVPVPPVNPAKLPLGVEEKKFEAVATPVVKMDTAPIPSPAKAEAIKAEVAENAAEKVTETTSTSRQAGPGKDEEFKLAAIAPSAGPTVAKAPSGSPDNLTRILFAENAADLPDDAQSGLQAIAQAIKESGRENVQLLAYGSGASVSAARRLSLGRALAVRSRLMELGVDNRQIEVRALGKPDGDGPADRVDLLLITR